MRKGIRDQEQGEVAQHLDELGRDSPEGSSRAKLLLKLIDKGSVRGTWGAEGISWC